MSFVDETERSELSELLLKDEVDAVVGAAIEVHRELGSGFLEGIYQNAMQIELRARGVPFEAERLISISYKVRPLSQNYFADLVCFDQIVVELKALDRLSGTEQAQVLSYLKATGLKVGLLINFGSHDKLEWKQFVR